jgi:UDP-N-acetylmuramoyl-L-alanyl-D-glutamate--2,6-diaminopimelate ligase
MWRMRLDDLLDGLSVLDMREVYPEMEVNSVTCDSRRVTPGCAFVAVPGTRTDGHDFIPQALSSGATVVIQSRPIEPTAVGSLVRVHDTREAYALLSARLAGNPSQRLRVIGVTGTNGKTSTTLLARFLLNRGGYRAAALGTLGLLRHDATEFEQRGLTTPDAGDLQQLLRDLADQGTTHVVMEVSSHALAQHRVTGVEFAGAVFTNLSQDHFDYHDTREAYLEAKASLFTRYLVQSGGYAVINTDDDAGRDIAARFGGIRATYGTAVENNLVLFNVEQSADGLSWELVIKNGVWPPSRNASVNHAVFHSPLVGRYNAYNCVAAAGVALLEGLSLPQVVDGLAEFDSVPGRLQSVPNDRGIRVFVDYAHTPDAVENVLAALSELRAPDVRLITVIGCGGDRDRDKRPRMGAAAQRYSDLTVVTSDNPRTEDPEAIIDGIFTGVDPQGHEVQRQGDRRQAIRQALSQAHLGDIVLVAGKGHEDYQILADHTVHFSDVEEVEAFFRDTQ